MRSVSCLPKGFYCEPLFTALEQEDCSDFVEFRALGHDFRKKKIRLSETGMTLGGVKIIVIFS